MAKRKVPANLLQLARSGELKRANTKKGTLKRRAVNAVEYERRQAKAQAEGFKGYGQKRYRTERAKKLGLPPPEPPRRARIIEREELTAYQQRQREAETLGWPSARTRDMAWVYVTQSDFWTYYQAYIEASPYDADEVVKAAWYAFRTESDDEYGTDSWHYYLFVVVLGYLTHEQWIAHYPHGYRFDLEARA